MDYDAPSKTVTIKLSGREYYEKERPNRVRIKNLYGFWKFKQKTPHHLLIFYQIHANPQLPASFFLNNYMVESTFQTLKNLKMVVQNNYR
jgi:hypothetical protein